MASLHYYHYTYNDYTHSKEDDNNNNYYSYYYYMLYTCQFVGYFVSNFVAVVTRVVFFRKIRLASFDSPFPKSSR